MNETVQILIRFFSRAIVLLLCIPIHEFAHGKTAYALGDPTAKQMGRLTLNPLRHLDFLGSLSMILIGVGWAKPVPVNPRYFTNPKRDFAWVSLAGPVANLVMGLLSFTFYKVTYIFFWNHPSSQVLLCLVTFFQFAAFINVLLAVFNFLPIPPLDGSKLAAAFLPDSVYSWFMRYEQIGILLVLGLMVIGVLQVPLEFFTQLILDCFDKLTFFVDLIMRGMTGTSYGQTTI